MTSARIAIAALLSLGIAACARQETPAPAAQTAAPQPSPAAVDPQSLLTIPARFPGDADEDVWRKSPQVLAFMNVKPGMQVLDYLAGGGYYSELLSGLVGPTGRVYAYNNPDYARYSGDTPAKRYANSRLANVTELTGPPETLTIEPGSLDAVLFQQTYHDLHWLSKDGSWTPTDPAKSLAQVVTALKPGGVVVVVDHVAAAGSDPDVSVEAMHRIDPALVKREFEAAGLVFDAESQVFHNPADDHSKPVFDESIRHKTDQFTYRFRKPS